MKTKPIVVGLVALSMIALTLPSCNKESADSNTGVELRVQAASKVYNVPPAMVSSTSSNASISWQSAMMWISRINLEATMDPTKAGEGKPVELFWQGPKEVDLFNMSQVIGTIGLAPGHYKSIRFEIVALASDAGKNPVLALTGTYTNSAGTSFPLTIDIRDDITIKSQKNNATIGKEGTGRSQVIVVYLDNLLSKELLDKLNLMEPVNGEIIISPTSNPELYRMILESIRNGRHGNNSDVQQSMVNPKN